MNLLKFAIFKRFLLQALGMALEMRECADPSMGRRPLCDVLWDTSLEIGCSLDMEIRGSSESSSVSLESSLGLSSHQVGLEGQESASPFHFPLL